MGAPFPFRRSRRRAMPRGEGQMNSGLAQASRGCPDVQLGEALADSFLKRTEFPEDHGSASRFPSFREMVANGVTPAELLARNLVRISPSRGCDGTCFGASTRGPYGDRGAVGRR